MLCYEDNNKRTDILILDNILGAGEMTQLWKKVFFFCEDSGSGSRTHVGELTNGCNSTTKGPAPSFGLREHQHAHLKKHTYA